MDDAPLRRAFNSPSNGVLRVTSSPVCCFTHCWVQDSTFLLFRKLQERRFLEAESLVSPKTCHMALDTNLGIAISKEKKRQGSSVSLNFWICFLKTPWRNFQRSRALPNPPTGTAVVGPEQLLQRTALENESLYFTSAFCFMVTLI